MIAQLPPKAVWDTLPTLRKVEHIRAFTDNNLEWQRRIQNNLRTALKLFEERFIHNESVEQVFSG